MSDRIPDGTVVLLLGGLEGSVWLWERDPQAMTVALKRLDDGAAHSAQVGAPSDLPAGCYRFRWGDATPFHAVYEARIG